MEPPPWGGEGVDLSEERGAPGGQVCHQKGGCRRVERGESSQSGGHVFQVSHHLPGQRRGMHSQQTGGMWDVTGGVWDVTGGMWDKGWCVLLGFSNFVWG